MISRAASGLALFCLVLPLSLAPVAVKAQDDGCMMDAFTYCREFIPDRERVAACLKANQRRISPGCRTALKRFK
jgi:hypothetical protein